MTYESEYFLVSMDDCKTYLSVDDAGDDAIIGRLMNFVSELFNTATDRKLINQDTTEYHTGDGTDTIFLRNYPVTSTNETIEVYVDWYRSFDADSKVDSEDLWVGQDYGELVYINSYFQKGRTVKVVYNAGYEQSEVPYDLQMAALETLGVLYKRRQEARFDTNTLSRGDVSYTYLDEFPHTVRDTLKRYRRW